MELFYRCFGEGQPIIIMHGLYGMSDNWVTHAKTLAKHYQVILPDMRNHGLSAHSNIFNYEAMSDDIGELMHTLQLENPVLMGHSMGGKVAMRFADDHPELISKLIVVDISLRQYKNHQFHTELIYAMMDIDFSNLTSRKEIETHLAKNIQDQRILMFILKNLQRNENEKFIWKLNLTAIFDNFDAITDEVKCSHIFEKPTLCIRGEKSDYISDEDVVQIQKYFPNAQFKTIPDAGHWVQADQPAVFMKVLKEFLDK
jgi:pimeloyl-ACP methyl ester carboxylesterase